MDRRPGSSCCRPPTGRDLRWRGQFMEYSLDSQSYTEGKRKRESTTVRSIEASSSPTSSISTWAYRGFSSHIAAGNLTGQMRLECKVLYFGREHLFGGYLIGRLDSFLNLFIYFSSQYPNISFSKISMLLLSSSLLPSVRSSPRPKAHAAKGVQQLEWHGQRQDP